MVVEHGDPRKGAPGACRLAIAFAEEGEVRVLLGVFDGRCL